MKDLFLFSILILFAFGLKSRSGEFYECINPYKKVNSASDCYTIQIPVSEGYKCCMMQITFNGNISRSCLTLETNYTTSKKTLEEYLSQNGLGAFFTKQGGKAEIDCGENFTVVENYIKLSDEFFSCYDGNKKGVENENDCINYDIPENETCKCCYVEISKINKTGNFENDKRCYIISDLYFTKEKNMRNFLLDQSNVKSLNDVNDTNVTIRCKNYTTFYYISKQNYSNEIYPITDYSLTDITTNQEYSTSTISDIEKTEIIKTDIPTNKELNTSDNENEDIIRNSPSKKKSSKTWLVILISIIACALAIGIIILVICKLKGKKNINNAEENTEQDIQISRDDGPNKK